MFADIKAAAGPQQAEDVAKALGGAEEALERDNQASAIALLEWAKAAASRSWAVREALGIAYYLDGRYRDAQRELLTYRRLAGREDQNHLLADCARAAGQGDKARAYVEAMLEAGVEESRVVEGLLVVAGERAEAGDVDGALRDLERARLGAADVESHHLRLWYLQAELHERRGEHEHARVLRERITEADPDFFRALEE